jgi:hypothetical protein
MVVSRLDNRIEVLCRLNVVIAPNFLSKQDKCITIAWDVWGSTKITPPCP